jgi:hypothetical protein
MKAETMKKTMRLVLEIDVQDLSEEDRADCADLALDDGPLPTLDDYSANEIAEVFEDMDEGELFAGSMVYARLGGSRVVSAEFLDASAVTTSDRGGEK